MAAQGFGRRGPPIVDSFHFGMDHMIELPANFILVVCVGVVAATVAFIVYGCIRGFRNVLVEDESKESKGH
jgi:hypothetical protein